MRSPAWGSEGAAGQADEMARGGGYSRGALRSGVAEEAGRVSGTHTRNKPRHMEGSGGGEGALYI